MAWWTTDNTNNAGNVTVHSPTGSTTGTSTPHTSQVWINGESFSTK
jgi:hypothetical protein